MRVRVSEAVPLEFLLMMFPDASDKFCGSCITQGSTVELGGVAIADMAHAPLGFLTGTARGSPRR